MDHYPDPARAQAEWTMAVQSVALACQNLLLAAEAHGVGACWMCAPLFVPELVRRVLELPGDWEPQALITLGYPAENKQKERAPLDSRVLWR
jgi:F420 biosynthesis protein FbiB-like protein